MTCAELQEVLPELIEGEREAELQAHLRSCQECAELVSDLRAIADQGRTLQASEEPPARVWQSIEAQLRREGLIRDSHPERPFLVVGSRRRWSPAIWFVPAAAALLLGVAFLLRPANPPIAQHPTPATSAQQPEVANSADTVADVDSTDDSALMDEVQKHAPAMTAAYRENLQRVNTYISDAQESLQRNPNDDDAKQYLMQAYEQKAMLYDMALDRALP
jgi:hypothetical protein